MIVDTSALLFHEPEAERCAVAIAAAPSRRMSAATLGEAAIVQGESQRRLAPGCRRLPAGRWGLTRAMSAEPLHALPRSAAGRPARILIGASPAAGAPVAVGRLWSAWRP